jgi:hypothetical protein
MATGEDVDGLRQERRRRLARRAAGTGAVAALLAAVVAVPAFLPDRPGRPAAAPTVATGPLPDGVPDQVVPWEGARPGGQPRQLTVTVIAGGGADSTPSDPCWEGYQPEARSEADRVVVTVRRFRSRAATGATACTSEGLLWNVTVPLPDDLGGRPLVDGATGQARPVTTDLLTPLWLPEGWKLVHETGGDGPGERWRRTYGPAAARPPDATGTPAPGKQPPGEELLIEVSVVEIEPRLLAGWNRWPDTPRLGPTDVRGVRAEVDADPRDRNLNVRWREGDRGYVVTGQVREGADPRHAESAVVNLARSLRRPCEPPPAVILDSWPQQFREAGGGTRPDQSRCR